MEEIRDDAPEQQPAPQRKMPLVPIIIIVGAVVVIGVAGMFMLRGGKAESTVEGREDIGASVEGASGVASRITPDPYYYFEDEFKVNTRDGYFVSARIVLKLEDYYIGSSSAKDGDGGHGGGEAAAGAGGAEAPPAPQGLLAQSIDENLPIIRDFIIGKFNGMTSDELTSPEGKSAFKQELMVFINDMFSGTAGKVVDLYFENLVLALP